MMRARAKSNCLFVSFTIHVLEIFHNLNLFLTILGDPGAGSEGVEKSRQAPPLTDPGSLRMTTGQQVAAI